MSAPFAAPLALLLSVAGALSASTAAPAQAAETHAPAPSNGPQPQGYTFQRGVNVNHWLGDNIAGGAGVDTLSYGAAWFDAEDVAWIADHGYDHLRLWVAGDRWIDADGELDEPALAPFDALLRWARAHRLGVVLAMHGLPGFRAAPRGAPDAEASPLLDATTQRDAARLWGRIARRYASIGTQLRFELLASPDLEDATQLRAYNSRMLAQIRHFDGGRVVYLTTRDMEARHLDDVVLDDPATALVLSFFEPQAFTWQFDPAAAPVPFPAPAHAGAEDGSGGASTEAALVEAIDALARRARARVGAHEIYIGQFGTLGRVDPVSATRWLRTVRDAFARNGLHWAVYDYATGGAVRRAQESDADYGSGEATHIHAALFEPRRDARDAG
jgi:endoglucanase